MNGTILQKCLDELKKDTDFRKDYVIGMLETLIEMSDSPKVVPLTTKKSIPAKPEMTDEAALLDARAKAALEIIKNEQN